MYPTIVSMALPSGWWIPLMCTVNWHFKHGIYPQSLQALWRWCWAANHNVLKDDRPVLFKAFRKLLYSKTREEYDSNLNEFHENEVVEKYPNFIAHVEQSYLSRSSQWAMYYRNELQLRTHGVNTSNLVESSFRVLKDTTLNRQKVKVKSVLNILLIYWNILGI